MGIISGVLGNASEVSPEEISREIKPFLIEKEKVEKAYRVVRDLFVFTDKRLILVDKQGVTGHKVEYHSIPYPSIVRFSVETAGHLDLDAELKLWLRGSSPPLVKKFKKSSRLGEIQSTLAAYVLG